MEQQEWSGISPLPDDERRPILRQVKGHAILWPLHFLEEADLSSGRTQAFAGRVGATALFT